MANVAKPKLFCKECHEPYDPDTWLKVRGVPVGHAHLKCVVEKAKVKRRAAAEAKQAARSRELTAAYKAQLSPNVQLAMSTGRTVSNDAPASSERQAWDEPWRKCDRCRTVLNPTTENWPFRGEKPIGNFCKKCANLKRRRRL